MCGFSLFCQLPQAFHVDLTIVGHFGLSPFFPFAGPRRPGPLAAGFGAAAERAFGPPFDIESFSHVAGTINGVESVFSFAIPAGRIGSHECRHCCRHCGGRNLPKGTPEWMRINAYMVEKGPMEKIMQYFGEKCIPCNHKNQPEMEGPDE